MTRAAAPLSLAVCLLAWALVAGCAAPGEPTARHPVVPVTVTDLAARQYGKAFELSFTLPARSMDREALAEHPTIEIYRAMLRPGAAPDKKTPWRLAYTIPFEQVDTYLKAGHIEFRDTLAPEAFTLPSGSSVAYKVRTSETKARASADSNIVTARIYSPLVAPGDVRVDVTEPALVLHWTQTPVPPGASARVYRVYRAQTESAQEIPPPDVSQAKLKTPLELEGTSTTADFSDPRFDFGTTYLYTVRSVEQFGSDFVESADSAPAIVTPRDVFPPAAPTGLEISIIPATARVPAYIELSWAISPEPDLAGYYVYRSDVESAPGERISTEILPSPTFHDMSVMPGRRYYYRVSALDRAGNESPKSAAVEVDVP